MFNRWIDIDLNKSALVIGPRRSGKTTLLRNLFKDYNYATLDDMDFLSWADRDPKGLIEHLGKKAIIDEIQRKPKLTIAVKYALDNQGAHIIMTGSSSIGLLDASADTLAGRINLYSLPTACVGENLGPFTHRIFFEKLDPATIMKYQRYLPEAISLGQFPEILNQKTTADKISLLNNYRDTYFIRDLMHLSNIENIDALWIILRHLVRSVGSHLEISNFAREAGVSFPTTKKYLNILNQSQLTFRLFGYQYGPAKRYIKAAKTYFSDNGIIKSLNLPLNEGQLLENFVIAELEKRRKLGFLQSPGFYYYKSAAGREVDLIFEENNKVYAIEIKSTINPSRRDVRNLIEFSTAKNQEIKRYLFYPGTEYLSIENVKVIPVAALVRGV